MQAEMADMEGLVDNSMCKRVRFELLELFESHSPALPSIHASAHIAECSLCRGTLAVLLASTLGAAKPPRAIRCSRCQQDIPAIVELMLAEGRAAVAQHYPEAWWHMWSCASCAEKYQMTRDLLEQAPAALLRPLMLLDPAVPARLRSALSRHGHEFLYHELALPLMSQHDKRGAAARAYRSSSLPGATIEFCDKQVGDRWLTVSITSQRHGLCRFNVHLVPPPAEELVLTLGTFEARARFDANGNASISGVPFELIAEPTGPDLELALE